MNRWSCCLLKKILIFAGIIFLFVLILSTWFFIGNLGNFAQFLGKEATKNLGEVKSRFVGTWETNTDFSLYTFKSDGSFTYNYIQGTYEINENNTLLLNYGSYEDFTSSLYTYQFSIDDTVLTLTNADNFEDILVLMKVQETD